MADTATLSVTTTAGQSDPASDVPRVFTVSGSTTTDDAVLITWRRQGGTACAANFATDQGTTFDTNPGGSGDVSFDIRHGAAHYPARWTP